MRYTLLLHFTMCARFLSLSLSLAFSFSFSFCISAILFLARPTAVRVTLTHAVLHHPLYIFAAIVHRTRSRARWIWRRSVSHWRRSRSLTRS